MIVAGHVVDVARVYVVDGLPGRVDVRGVGRGTEGLRGGAVADLAHDDALGEAYDSPRSDETSETGPARNG